MADDRLVFDHLLGPIEARYPDFFAFTYRRSSGEWNHVLVNAPSLKAAEMFAKDRFDQAKNFRPFDGDPAKLAVNHFVCISFLAENEKLLKRQQRGEVSSSFSPYYPQRQTCGNFPSLARYFRKQQTATNG